MSRPALWEVLRTDPTEADREVLRFLAEHRVVTAAQVQALLAIGPRPTDRRLVWLERQGLLVRRRVFDGHPATCWITRRGLGVIASRLPVPRLDLKGHRHDVGVAWMWLAARSGAFGALRDQVSERAMRSHDGRRPADGGRFGIGVGEVGPGGGRKLHYPDLLLRSASGHRIAVELELTGKSARRLDRIMLGYAVEAQIDAVLYLCESPRVSASVREAARRAGIADRVHVQRFAAGSPHGSPHPAQAASRGSTRERTPTRAPRVAGR